MTTHTTIMTKTTPQTTREAVHALLHELNLKGMTRVLDGEIERSERNGASAIELVQRLLAEQASYQRERSLLNRVAQAKLPWQWTIDTFPFERQSGVNKAQILGLADMDFVRRAQNLVLIGGLRIPVNVITDSGNVTGNSGERDRWVGVARFNFMPSCFFG